MDCLNSPLTQCCYCGQSRHITFESPLLQQPRSNASTANSTTTEKKDKCALVAKSDCATSTLAKSDCAKSDNATSP